MRVSVSELLRLPSNDWWIPNSAVSRPMIGGFRTPCTSVAYRGSPAPGGQCLHRRPPPPPRELAPPPPCRIGLHGWRLRGSGCAPPPPPRLVNPASATALCNEVTLLICLGLIFFLQLGPTSWAGAPPRLAGAMPPPPPRHATASRLPSSGW